MTTTALKRDSFYNPLDIVEMVIMDRDWVFDRTNDGELIAEAEGQWCKYHVGFVWEESHQGLALTCALDTKFPKAQLAPVHALLAIVNEKLWLGHFDACSETMCIVFRYSLLFKHAAHANAEQLSDLIDIAIEECERFYPAFQSVVWGGKSPEQALAMALFETIAEA